MSNYGATGDDGPSESEIEDNRIAKAGGQIVKGADDFPKIETYQIIRWGGVDADRYPRHICFRAKEPWIGEIKLLTHYKIPFTAFRADKPVTTSIRVDVEVT